MATFNIQEQNFIKPFNLSYDNNIYKNTKLIIENYLKNINYPINSIYKGYQLEVIPRQRGGIPIFWCGYISYNDNNKLDYIFKTREIHGDWTYQINNKIGFDCHHLNDLYFSNGIDDLDYFNNQDLDFKTYKGPQWVLKQLKDVIDLDN